MLAGRQQSLPGRRSLRASLGQEAAEGCDLRPVPGPHLAVSPSSPATPPSGLPPPSSCCWAHPQGLGLQKENRQGFSDPKLPRFTGSQTLSCCLEGQAVRGKEGRVLQVAPLSGTVSVVPSERKPQELFSSRIPEPKLDGGRVQGAVGHWDRLGPRSWLPGSPAQLHSHSPGGPLVSTGALKGSPTRRASASSRGS